MDLTYVDFRQLAETSLTKGFTLNNPSAREWTIRMMHFVLDANTVVAGQFGASAHLSALLSASSAVGYRVCLPKIALEEISAKYGRELAKCARVASKSLTRLTKLMDKPLDSPFDAFDLKEEGKRFEDRLLAQLRAAESLILDYPETSHEDLVKRATLRTCLQSIQD